MKKPVIASVLVSCAAVAGAQTPTAAPAQPYARVVSLEGLVTVTTANRMANASNGMELVKGAQVLTSGNGNVTIRFSNGCTATLRPGQSMEVQESQCALLLARAQSVPTTAGGVDPLRNPFMLGWGAVGAAIILNQGDGKVSGS